MSKMYKIDSNLGLQDMEVAMSNENPEVGQCTVWHSQFAVALMFVLQGYVADALEILKAIFGAHKRGNNAYVSPLEESRSADGFSFIGLGFSMVTKAVKNASSCVLDAVNGAAICGDFIAFGRMFQEAIIDAAKKGGRIVIEYAKGMKGVALASRSLGSQDFNVRILWADADQSQPVRKGWSRDGLVEYICRDRLEGKGRVGRVLVNPDDPTSNTKLWVNDPFWELGKVLLGVVRWFARKTTEFTPSFSEKLLASIDEKLQKDVTFRVLVRAIQARKVNAYRTLTGAMRAELDNARGLYWDRDDLKAHQKEIKARYRDQFAEMGNEIRRETKLLEDALGVKFDVFTVVKALIWLSYHKDDGSPVEDQRVADNFADCSLEAEFAVFMLRAMKGAGEDVPEESRDELLSCTIAVPENEDEDPLKVRFELGHAEVRDKAGRVLGEAEAEANLNGVFMIRKIGGKFYACQNIEERLVAQIPAADMTRLQFVTAGTAPVGEGVNSFISQAAGKEVVLCRKVKGADGKAIDNAVVFNGKVVSRYRPTILKDKGLDKAFSGKVMKAFDGFYDGYAGTVIAASTYKVDVSGRPFVTSVITLENVHKVEGKVEVKEDLSQPAVAKPEAKEEVKKEEAPAATAYRCSFFD